MLVWRAYTDVLHRQATYHNHEVEPRTRKNGAYVFWRGVEMKTKIELVVVALRLRYRAVEHAQRLR